MGGKSPTDLLNILRTGFEFLRFEAGLIIVPGHGVD